MKPRSFGQIIGDSFKTYFTDIAKYTFVAAIVIIPVALLSGGLWAIGDYTRTAADGWSSNLAKWIVTDLLFPAGTILLTLVAYPLMQSALIRATAQKRLGQRMDVGQSYFVAISSASRLIGTSLVSAVLVSAMLVSLICLPFALSQHLGWLYVLTAVLAVGIPFAFYFSIRWLFLFQTVMVEGRRITQTFPRSSDLVAGNWWRSFGIWALFAVTVPLIVGFVSGLLLAVLMAFGRLGGSGVFGIVVYLNIVPALVLVPLSAVAQTVLYFDLRARNEQCGSAVMASELGRGQPEAPAILTPERVSQAEATHTWQPRRLNSVFIVVAVVVLLSALVPPAILLLPEYVDRGDIQVSVRRISTGKHVEIGHGTLKTFNFTDFALVVDFNASVRAGDEDNAIVADVKPWGGDYWVHSSAHVGVFAVKETKDDFFANGSVPERDPANEVSTTVEILDEEHILVSPEAGEFPSGSQIVLYLDFGGGSGWCARLFTP